MKSSWGMANIAEVQEVEMRRRILSNVTLRSLSRDRRRAYFTPSGGFWSIWRTDKDIVRALNFAPIKTEDGWRVRWYGEVDEINETLFSTPQAEKESGFDTKKRPAKDNFVVNSFESQIGSQRTKKASAKDFHPNPPETEDNSFANCQIKPFHYQVAVINQLCSILKERKRAIDASDTGVGKTYVASFIAKMMCLKPIVICPKSAIGTWRRTLLGVGFESADIFIGNYEQWVCGNCYEFYDFWKFRGTEKHLVIVDEVHKCRNAGTKNARLLAKISQSDAKLLMLSATAIESPEKSITIASALGLCQDTISEKRRWLVQHGCIPRQFGGEKLKFHGGKKYLIKMHNAIFPKCGVRLRINDIPGFPECRHIVDPITLDGSSTKKVAKSLQRVQTLREQLNSLKEYELRSKVLSEMQRERQEVELHKLPVIRQLADELVAECKAVAIFLNFRASIDRLRTIYGPMAAYVHGGQSMEERERAVASFQADQVPVIILNIEAGGSSISLHDIRGKRQRHSLISPNWSAITFKQVLGRIHRSGARSPAIQRIVLVDGTIETTISARLQAKLQSIATINDGDLS
jgi:superfamily II DNA or RNA helicase